jgi:Zn-dependent peptidase ImmA (M78 family)/DNA-binding XRE family transcriptional regulator
MKTNAEFSRTRLQLARAFNEITQAELGERLGVGQAFIGLIETGRKQPSDLLVSAMADTLGVEPKFFFEPTVDEFRVDDWSFLRYQSASATDTNRLLAHGTLLCMLTEFMDSALKLPADNVPTVPRPTNREEIERAADLCRMQLGLGLDVPIKNVIRAFERAGVMVATVGGRGGKIDAISRSVGKRGIILLSDDKGSASRRLFDASHEGGHLVMHAGIETGTHETEDEANMFASAFLLPRRGFVREFPRPPSKGSWTRSYWKDLFDMKKRWRASVAAIIRRGFDLKMLDAAQYQRAMKFMSAHGWLRHGEPPATEPEMEKPELLPNAFEVLEKQRGITPRDVAAALGWKPETLAKIIPKSVSVEPPPADDSPGARVLLFPARA